MDLLKPRDEPRYDVAITFSTDRLPIAGYMPVREYRRMMKDIRKQNAGNAYEMIIDGHVAEMLFPITEVDTVTALPEVTEP